MPMIPEAKGHCLAGRSRASSVSSAPYLRWPFQEFLDPLTGSTTSPRGIRAVFRVDPRLKLREPAIGLLHRDGEGL
ncbi:MAG: hypothetical protein EB071_10230 [Gammaproteobacteria bacterium]|nr:hypothetical protein [Gammaproteobacteria bacterium]